MKPLGYEAHITFSRDWIQTIAVVWAVTQQGWKLSKFDADPVLGDKPYAYLTHYDTDAIALLDQMQRIANALRETGVPVIREKIEAIVYDTKTGVDRITVRGPVG